jgi:hypothetical protein
MDSHRLTEALLRALALIPHWGRRRRDSICNANREVLRISRFRAPNHDEWKFGFLGKVPYTPRIAAQAKRSSSSH